MDWKPIAALIDWTARSDLHSGRPAIEQTAQIQPGAIRQSLWKAGGGDTILFECGAFDGPIKVDVLVKLIDRGDDGGTLVLVWEYRPEVGEPYALTQKIQMRAMPTLVGRKRLQAECPHCGRIARYLSWAVLTWSCVRCLGLKSERARLGKRYVRAKQSRQLREALGVSPIPLSPIVVRRREHVALAEKLWQLELAMASDARAEWLK